MKNTDPNIAKPPTARKAPRSTLVKKITTVSGTATTVLGTIILIWGALSTSRTEFVLPTRESPPPSPPVFIETLIFRVPVAGSENEEDTRRNMLAEVAAVDASDVRTEFGTEIVAFIDVPSRNIVDVSADLSRTATSRLNVCCGITATNPVVLIAAPPSVPSTSNS